MLSIALIRFIFYHWLKVLLTLLVLDMTTFALELKPPPAHRNVVVLQRNTVVRTKAAAITSTRTTRAAEAATANCTSICCTNSQSRRLFITSVGSLISSISGPTTICIGVPGVAQAAETIGKDENCNDSNCLGVWDGLLADCPHSSGKQIFLSGAAGGGATAGCTSSQDDTPGIFAEPWDYSETTVDLNNSEEQMKSLVSAIQQVAAKRGDDVRIILQQGRYLRVVFKDGNTGEASVGEFYFTPSDTTVQFRVASLLQQQKGSGGGGGGTTSLLLSPSQRNMDRAESIRKELGFLKLPVLRNRKRSLFFVESDFDTFGPGSAMLGPPAEMSAGDLEGRQDMDKTQRKLDTVQAFPFR